MPMRTQSPLLCIIVLASIAVQVKPAERGTEEDPTTSLLSRPSRVHGWVKKAGMVPVELWDRHLYNPEPWLDWLYDVQDELPPEWPQMEDEDSDASDAEEGGKARQPAHSSLPAFQRSRSQLPRPSRCNIGINHHYKFIFIRNRKAASTTIRQAFAAGCDSGENVYQCMHFMLDLNETLAHSLAPRTIEQLWKDYFVFTTSRNVWTRAVSSYEYVLQGWDKQQGSCTPPSFLDFCHQPYSLGIVSDKFQCKAWHAELDAETQRVWDWAHVDPVASCITDSGGSLAVDYIVRSENVHEDMDEVVKILNERRSPRLPAIDLNLRFKNLGMTVDKSEVLAPVLGRKLAAGSRQEQQTQRRADEQAAGSVQPGSAQPHGLSQGMDDGVRRQVRQSLVSERKAALLVDAIVEEHAEKYKQCGMQCIRSVADFYRRDMELFGFSLPEDFKM